MGQDGSQDSSDQVQVKPKASQNGSKMSQVEPKMGAKMGQDRAKSIHELRRVGHDGAKMRSRSAQHG